VRKDVERTRLIADDELARIRSAIDMVGELHLSIVVSSIGVFRMRSHHRQPFNGHIPVAIINIKYRQMRIIQQLTIGIVNCLLKDLMSNRLANRRPYFAMVVCGRCCGITRNCSKSISIEMVLQHRISSSNESAHTIYFQLLNDYTFNYCTCSFFIMEYYH